MRAPSEPSAPTPAVQAELSPEELARALRAMANELERDPSFAHRITEAIREPALPRPPSRQSSRRSRSQARAAAPAGEETTATAVPDTAKTTKASKPKSSEGFQPRVVEGAAPELGVGIPDPFMLRERLGEDGFRRALDDLRLGTLRAMVREYRLDPEGAAVRGNDAAKLRALILERTASR